MNYTLGISLGFNASACIMDESQNVLYAASEERFTNKKNCKQFPLLAIKNGLEFTGISPEDIKTCNYSHYQNADIYDIYRHTYGIDDKINVRNYPKHIDDHAHKYFLKKFEEEFIYHHLYMLGIAVRKIERINHHYAHAACAYNLSPFHNSNLTNLYVVMDGFGDGESITMWIEKDNALKKIESKPMFQSVALVYQFVTGALGYKEHQHEGKLTGLAAYGHDTKYYDDFEALYDNFKDIEHDENVKSPIIDFDIFTEMKKRTYDFVNNIIKDMSPEEKFEESKHIAASLQRFAEFKALDYIGRVIRQNGFEKVNVLLSGGLFANVKINQKVHEFIPQVANVFVAPPMGDEGTCIGAACGTVLVDKSNSTMTNMTMRMGTSHVSAEVSEVIEGLIEDDIICDSVQSVNHLAKAIANDLSKNKIVCLFDGRMEFGPRALIGRSIMYNCRDVGANDWLNKQLGRTEFMPFAPFCKEEHCDDLFYDVAGKEYALKNMTVTVDCKDEFIQNYPAACHVDATARPQVISKNENEIAWAILDEYEAITGEKALINTSFNLHNYPIIESPKVAVLSWLKSNTHSLYIGCDGLWYKLSRK